MTAQRMLGGYDNARFDLILFNADEGYNQPNYLLCSEMMSRCRVVEKTRDGATWRSYCRASLRTRWCEILTIPYPQLSSHLLFLQVAFTFLTADALVAWR